MIEKSNGIFTGASNADQLAKLVETLRDENADLRASRAALLAALRDLLARYDAPCEACVNAREAIANVERKA